MDYSRIPDGADLLTVKNYLSSFLNEKDELTTKNSLFYSLEMLSNIAEQCAFYQLDEELKSLITDYLIGIIDHKDYRMIDIILFITVNMALKGVIEYLLNLKQEIPCDIMEMINESAAEMNQ